MQVKDYVFYTMLCSIVLYYLFFIIKFVTVRQALKEEFPECMTIPYLYQIQIVCSTWFTVLAMKKLTLVAAEGALNKRLDPARFPIGSHQRTDKIHKVSDHMIKILFYLISFVWIFLVMKDSNFLHVSSGGKMD